MFYLCFYEALGIDVSFQWNQEIKNLEHGNGLPTERENK